MIKCSCILCKKETTTNNINKHYNKCLVEGIPRIDLICQFCSKEYFNLKGVVHHENYCKNNPNKKQTGWAIYVKNNGIWNKGLTQEDDVRVAKISKSIKKIMQDKAKRGILWGSFTKDFWSEEKRSQKSEEKKKLYLEFPEKHPNRKVAGNRNKMTYPEKIAFDWFVTHNIEFEHQKRIENKFADFCIGNLIIEIDGDYWHPIGNERDKQKDEMYKVNGYDVVRIRASENIEDRLKELFSH